MAAGARLSLRGMAGAIRTAYPLHGIRLSFDADLVDGAVYR